MKIADALPERPLSLSEMAVLADSNGIDGVEPIAYNDKTSAVVCMALVAGDQLLTVGWHPENGGWKVIDQQNKG